jgi:hypothetical protein
LRGLLEVVGAKRRGVKARYRTVTAPLPRCEAVLARVWRETRICHLDLIEHDGEDMRDLPFLDRKNALAGLLRHIKAGILLNEHIAEDRATVLPTRASRCRGHRIEEDR